MGRRNREQHRNTADVVKCHLLDGQQWPAAGIG
jgi:hypothetical protein